MKILRVAALIVRVLLSKRDADSMTGDLAEEYALRKDLAWLMGQVLRSLADICWSHLRRLPPAITPCILLLLFQAGAYLAANLGLVAAMGFSRRSGVRVPTVFVLTDFFVMLGISFLFGDLLGRKTRPVLVLLVLLTIIFFLLPWRIGWGETLFALVNPLALLVGSRLKVQQAERPL